MQQLVKLYGMLIVGLAALSGVTIVVMTGLILGDVSMRYLGLGTIQSSSTLIEYGLLFSTMLGAPWLVRKRGHITVTSLVDMLPETGRKMSGLVVLIISIITLGVLGWRSAMVAYDKWLQGSMDVRSVALPEWISYAILATGFLLMASESIRLILLKEVEPEGSAAT